ncbi:radical SAM protein [Desulfobotulus sp. H1]|uniref:Radical SAM protein n=1 Tax=Desulfobotulus pelophilus TaxID=2823377 RepID=A0ABT3N7V0_9BACT|nr:radical SAM protein [Desulfobotulus pelophilus]MCW7753536.1 radical SAM protein [Desulfobotulus pelophilus]
MFQERISPLHTPAASGEARGFIEFQGLQELWFHTGTDCNLSCPDCFEHSGPGVHRLAPVTLEDVKPFMAEGLKTGARQFSFTGGEPFLNKEIIPILEHALNIAPCLVLSNGTRPMQARLEALLPLKEKPHRLTFRISLDHPDAIRHDAGRGEGMFELALTGIRKLLDAGFGVSVACRREDGDRSEAYRKLFKERGLPEDLHLVSFPDLQEKDTPEITQSCMQTCHTPKTSAAFMCAFSRMVVKKKNRMAVYACTLVDNDAAYDMGEELEPALKARTILAHPRCFTCFAGGVSCSEL